MHPSTVDDRPERFRQHLVNFMDDDGLILGEVCIDGPRPYCNGDFLGYQTWDLYADDHAGFIGYEDALMTTGRFIYAEVLRHLQADEGSDLCRAQRGAEGLLAVAAVGDTVESGYLPKPHRGLAHAAASVGISADQYEHVLFGLWALRQHTADQGLQARIDGAIVRWADYFMRHDYSYLAFGRLKSELPESPHMVGLYLPLAAIASQITNSATYLDHALPRLLPIIEERFIAPPAPATGQVPNPANLSVLGLAYCARRDIAVDTCRQAVARLAATSLSSLSHDGLAYCYQGASDATPITIGYRPGPSPLNYRFLSWRSNVKGADSCKLAQTLFVAADLLGHDDWLATAQRILARFRDISDFRRYHDTDGTQIPDDYAYLRQALCNQFVGAWLQTYYLLKSPGLLVQLEP